MFYSMLQKKHSVATKNHCRPHYYVSQIKKQPILGEHFTGNQNSLLMVKELHLWRKDSVPRLEKQGSGARRIPPLDPVFVGYNTTCFHVFTVSQNDKAFLCGPQSFLHSEKFMVLLREVEVCPPHPLHLFQAGWMSACRGECLYEAADS